jgi:ABC-type transport system involved in multi-copper enzyme maturation permease subunit
LKALEFLNAEELNGERGEKGMILRIARKDFLNNLLSARFVIGFVLCLFLVPFSVLINIDDYSEQASLYRLDRDAAEKSLKEIRVYSALRPEIVFPPEPLSIFDKGLSNQVGNKLRIQLGEIPLLTEGKTTTRDNPFLASFFSVDFVDIAAVIFSLLALLFSYDALTREKEDGTLRQQMANSLKRSHLLAGKVAGILLTLLPVLVFCFLLGAIIVLASGDVSFSGREWGRLALLVLVSLVYLAVFAFLGLLVSARTKTSVTSLVYCLFLWVLLIFIVPNLSSYLAESFVGIKSRDNLNVVLADMDKAFDKRVEAAARSLTQPDWWMNWYSNSGDDGFEESYGCTASYFEYKRRRASISEPMRLDNADLKWGPQKEYFDSLTRQTRTADLLSMVSPSGIFRLVGSALCGTDWRAQEKRLEDLRRYRETFVRYLQSKNIFSSFSYITAAPPSTFRTADELVAARSGGEFRTLAEYESWVEKQTDFRAQWQVLYKVRVPRERPEDYPYLTVDDLPRFPVGSASLLAGFEISIIRLGLLVFEFIFLFALGYVAFIRYDVR